MFLLFSVPARSKTPLRISDYAGHLIIDWGKGFRAWVQRADRKDKAVLEIRKKVKEEPFPGFTQFCWDIDQIAAVPLAWQEVLRNVKGVYLAVCKETGKQYVGSAKGEESLWGRFLDYAKTGHGGNVELKRRKSRGYQVTILEVVNSDNRGDYDSCSPPGRLAPHARRTRWLRRGLGALPQRL